MAATRCVNLLRPPGEGIGLRITGGGLTVSTLKLQSVAYIGGLREGDTIVSINGNTCSAQKTASDVMDELIKRSTAKFTVEIRRGPPESAAAPPKRPLEQQAQGDAPPAASEHQAAKKKKADAAPPAAAPPPAAPAPQPARPPAKAEKAFAAGTEATRLLKLLRSDAVDVKKDLLAKLKAGHKGTIDVLSELYPASANKTCVFCKGSFVAGCQGQCSVICDVSWDDFEREFAGYSGRGTHSGKCMRCGRRVDAEGHEDSSPSKSEIPVCYRGPHTADKRELERHYKEPDSDD